jgi:hypothetical protein
MSGGQEVGRIDHLRVAQATKAQQSLYKPAADFGDARVHVMPTGASWAVLGASAWAISDVLVSFWRSGARAVPWFQQALQPGHLFV